MKQIEWTVTSRLIATLVGGWGAMPAPDDDDFNPRGPIGPIAFELRRRLADRFSAVALNPQPLPPVDGARLLGQSFVAEMAQLRNLADALPKESAGTVQARMTMRTSEFIEWCGTGALAQKIAELLKKLGPPKGGGEPPPRPDEMTNALARLAIGAELYVAGSQIAGLQEAGEKLMAQGLKQLG